MVIAPQSLRFWLPILIRPLRTFFFHNFRPKKYGIHAKSPRGTFFSEEPWLQNCIKHISVAILSYFDYSENLEQFIYFHFHLWSESPEVMTTFKTGLETKRMHDTIQGLHLHGRMAEYFWNAILVQSKRQSLRTEIIGTLETSQSIWSTHLTVRWLEIVITRSRWTPVTVWR